MNFNRTMEDALRGVSITNFVENAEPSRKMIVYVSKRGWVCGTGRCYGSHSMNEYGQFLNHNGDVIHIFDMLCWQLHNRRCNNIVERIVGKGMVYHIAFSQVRSEGILWPLSDETMGKNIYIAPTVTVESSKDIESMIEHNIMEEIKKRVTSLTNMVQGK